MKMLSENNKKCLVIGVLTGVIVAIISATTVIFLVRNQLDNSAPKAEKHQPPPPTGANESKVKQKSSEKLSRRVYERNLELQANLALMKNRWKETLIGNSELISQLSEDQYAKKYMADLPRWGQTLFQSINRNEDAEYLWPKRTSETRSAHLTTQFSKLATIAKAYGIHGTALYRRKNVLRTIKNGLNILTKANNYDGKQYYGNWWDWQIGVPSNFVAILFILVDELPTSTITAYARIISSYISDPLRQLPTVPQEKCTKINHTGTTDGTNRVDIAFNIIGVGIILQNFKTITSAVDSVSPDLLIATEGNGFYEDGSYIFHRDIPYTGAYGNSFIYAAGKMFSLTANTYWQFEQEVLDNFVFLTVKSFIPLLINGGMMHMVRGREISRSPQQDSYSNFVTPYNLLIVANFAKNSSYKNRLQQTAKYWIEKDGIDVFANHARDIMDLHLLINVINNLEIDTNTKPFIGSTVYGSMDRVVFSNSYYTAGISMYSNRISSFEAGNMENKRGWHTSDGMLYLYNGDEQFGNGYWPTVDPYRLPGTTVDTVKLEDETNPQWQVRRSSEPFVGGVTDGKYAVAMMQLNKKGTLNNNKPIPMNLTAKKSWFMFGDAIIALGSDINGVTSATIETVIENRMINGEVLVKGDNWWLLQNPKRGERGLGYLLLQKKEVQIQKQESTGSYNKINKRFDGDIVYTKQYEKILIVHGNNVINSSYAYAIIPNADAKIMRNIQNRFKIIHNNENVQSVYDEQQELLGAVIWNNKGGEANGYTLNTSGSFLVQKERLSTQHIIAISNPKQSPEILQLSLPFNTTLDSKRSPVPNKEKK